MYKATIKLHTQDFVTVYTLLCSDAPLADEIHSKGKKWCHTCICKLMNTYTSTQAKQWVGDFLVLNRLEGYQNKCYTIHALFGLPCSRAGSQVSGRGKSANRTCTWCYIHKWYNVHAHAHYSSPSSFCPKLPRMCYGIWWGGSPVGYKAFSNHGSWHYTTPLRKEPNMW